MMTAKTYPPLDEITEALRQLEADDPGLTGVQRDFIREWICRAEESEESIWPGHPNYDFADLPNMFGQGAYIDEETGERHNWPRMRPTEEAAALLLSFNRCPSSIL